MPGNNIQLDDNGKLQHFLSIEGLNQEILTEILDTAASFTSVTDTATRPASGYVTENPRPMLQRIRKSSG